MTLAKGFFGSFIAIHAHRIILLLHCVYTECMYSKIFKDLKSEDKDL